MNTSRVNDINKKAGNLPAIFLRPGKVTFSSTITLHLPNHLKRP
jgi:hypothetical protein